MEWHQPTSLQIHMTKEWSRVRYRPSGMIIGRVLHCTPHQEPGADTSKVAIAAVDTLLWQALASVIVPGFSHHHDINIAYQQIFLDRSLKFFFRFHNKPHMLGRRPRSCQGSSRGGCDCQELDGDWSRSWRHPTHHPPHWQVSSWICWIIQTKYFSCSGVHVVMDNTTRKLIGGVPRKQEWFYIIYETHHHCRVSSN